MERGAPVADEWTVADVRETVEGDGVPCYRVYLDTPRGTHLHVFPADTLEWRAAEYGIDPSDVDTLLDIVLHEPHIDEPGNPFAIAAGQAVPDDGPTLFTADTVDQAREAHLRRIERVKADKVRISIRPPARRPDAAVAARGAGDPLDVIRRRQLDPERVAAKAKLVAAERARVATARRARGA